MDVRLLFQIECPCVLEKSVQCPLVIMIDVIQDLKARI